MIRLYHPQHGYHILSYGDDENVFEANGWRREQDEPPRDDVPDEVPAAIEVVKPRRGRKPKTQ